MVPDAVYGVAASPCRLEDPQTTLRALKYKTYQFRETSTRQARCFWLLRAFPAPTSPSLEPDYRKTAGRRAGSWIICRRNG